ncbi:hypothetical protein Bca52824_016741 [Brassica carinata]|uniref:Uncharacterized protein n=1 Tax=Brassica carinata TaxID=52824 RepID=A0A8X8B6Q0_BRACI|nr:hypothetical protein Bca52824_016741 [Brassica carinata]
MGSTSNTNKAKRKKGEASSSSIPSMPTRVWQPGVDKFEEGEELHDKLGLNRTEFPHTLYMVAGTQISLAEKAPWNSIGLFKISNIYGKRRDVVPKNLVNGCVNRIRAMPQNPHICVSWADSGHVQVWDMSSHLNALSESETEGKDGTSLILNQAPLLFNIVKAYLFFFFSHWLGDCMSMIQLWEPASGSWTVDPIPLSGHTASVEDLQSPGLSFKAHNADVNVISWNRLASCMLASGSDDGAFSIHDLRVIKETPPRPHGSQHGWSACIATHGPLGVGSHVQIAGMEAPRATTCQAAWVWFMHAYTSSLC